MRDIYLAGVAAWLPPAVSAKQAAARGEYAEEDLAANGIRCVPVAGAGDAPPDMASRAAATALARAAERVPTTDVGLVLHACLYHQGRDYFWSPASYVQRSAGLSAATAVQVGQMSNGGMAAVEVAAGYLGSGRATAALVTTADRFCQPGFDRWQADYGIVYGDGAAAAVLSTAGGFARFAGMRTLTDPTLEQMHRGTVPLTDTVGAVPIDVRRAKREYVMSVGLESVLQRSTGGLAAVIDGALADAGCSRDELKLLVLPNLGHQLLAGQYLGPLGLPAEQTLMAWGAHTGHLGAGDQLAAVAHLVESRMVEPGDQVLLIGAGGGFSWSAAVLSIEAVPDWPEPTAAPGLPDDVRA
jgi:3-oxoacyl-[acyl-carrier-protein] synthase-3